MSGAEAIPVPDEPAETEVLPAPEEEAGPETAVPVAGEAAGTEVLPAVPGLDAPDWEVPGAELGVPGVPGATPGGLPGGDAARLEAPEPMCRMLFVDVVLVLPSTHPVVVLQEADPPYRELRIPIGGPEGVAIGYAARQLETPRPLTHELMSRLLAAFSLSLDVVRITATTGRVYLGEIVVSGPSGSRTIDCRPSDALALALRQRIPVPIMASPVVLEAAGGEAAGSN